MRARIVGAVDEIVSRHRVEQNAELRAQIDACVRAEVDRVVAEIRDVEIRDRRDTFAAAERDAVASTARFVQREMRQARSFPHRAGEVRVRRLAGEINDLPAFQHAEMGRQVERIDKLFQERPRDLQDAALIERFGRERDQPRTEAIAALVGQRLENALYLQRRKQANERGAVDVQRFCGAAGVAAAIACCDVTQERNCPGNRRNDVERPPRFLLFCLCHVDP